MNEINLKVPATVEVPIEFVSQGNHSAELAPGGTITTKSRTFADYLIGKYGLTEIGEPEDASDEDDGQTNSFEAQYPADFPYRKIFIDAAMPMETVKGLTRDQLMGIRGLGEKSADAVLAYAPAPPSAPALDADNSDNGGSE